MTVISGHDKPQPPGCLLESVIYHEQQIRDEQERQARLERERARSWHEEQEREARVWRGPSMGM
ncbi:mobilization protein (plasmid) [Escherichia coli]